MFGPSPSPLSEWGGKVGEIVWFGFGAGKDNITGHIMLEPPPPGLGVFEKAL